MSLMVSPGCSNFRRDRDHARPAGAARCLHPIRRMAYAYFTAHAPHGPLPILNHGEPVVLFCFIYLFISAHGAGPWSVDAMFGRGRHCCATDLVSLRVLFSPAAAREGASSYSRARFATPSAGFNTSCLVPLKATTVLGA